MSKERYPRAPATCRMRGYHTSYSGALMFVCDLTKFADACREWTVGDWKSTFVALLADGIACNETYIVVISPHAETDE